MHCTYTAAAAQRSAAHRIMWWANGTRHQKSQTIKSVESLDVFFSPFSFCQFEGKRATTTTMSSLWCVQPCADECQASVYRIHATSECDVCCNWKRVSKWWHSSLLLCTLRAHIKHFLVLKNRKRKKSNKNIKWQKCVPVLCHCELQSIGVMLCENCMRSFITDGYDESCRRKMHSMRYLDSDRCHFCCFYHRFLLYVALHACEL